MGESTRHQPTAFQLGFPRAMTSTTSTFQEKNGVVYTKPWVVELMLELAGYTAATNLVDTLAVEPAAGDGAFLIPMAERLVASCQRQQRPIRDAVQALIAYELDEASAGRVRDAVVAALIALDIAAIDAEFLAKSWVQTGDYLFDAPTLPRADFVIGNPPYIRLEDMDEGIAASYRTMYRTMKGRADIYVAFFEAALRQLKPQGVCTFICADRWMLNQYGAELRRLVTQGFSVEAVIEMHNADAFRADVSAYPAITVIRRAAQEPAVVARGGREIETVGSSQLATILHDMRNGAAQITLPNGLRAARVSHWFQADDPWPCVSPERLALLQRLEQEFEPLANEATGTKVGIGVATGADAVFITTDPDLVEPERLLPLAMAYDIKDGHLNWSGHYLVDPWMPGGLVHLATYPRLRAYLEANREQLVKRHVAKRSGPAWYRTIDRVNHKLTRKPKLYIPDIKDRIEPVLDHGKTYPHHNLYVVHSDTWDLEVLGGLLFSAIGQFFVECYGVRMRGGYLRFQAQYLRRIRVPNPTAISEEQAALLTQAFRQRDRELASQVALSVYGIEQLPVEESAHA